MNGARAVFLSALAVALCALPCLAQDDEERVRLETGYREKLALPFVAKIPWQRSFDEAREAARREKKLILGYFTLSYRNETPEPVRRFEEGPLIADWWKEASGRFVPYLNISAKLLDKPDQGLFLDKDGNYFPLFLIMDETGRRLLELRPISREAVELALADATLKRELLKASEDGTDIPSIRGLRLLRLILREIDLADDEVARLLATKGLDDRLRRRYEDYRSMQRVQEVFRQVQREERIEDIESDEKREERRQLARKKIAKRLYGLLSKDVTFPLPSNSVLWLNYAIMATRGALEAKDAKVARRAFDMILRAESLIIPKRDRNRSGGGFRKRIKLSEIRRQLEALEKS